MQLAPVATASTPTQPAILRERRFLSASLSSKEPLTLDLGRKHEYLDALGFV